MSDGFNDLERRVERGEICGSLLVLLFVAFFVPVILGLGIVSIIVALAILVVFVLWLCAPPFTNPFDPY